MVSNAPAVVVCVVESGDGVVGRRGGDDSERQSPYKVGKLFPLAMFGVCIATFDVPLILDPTTLTQQTHFQGRKGAH